MAKPAIKNIKTELEQLTQKELVQICLRLAKYKKDNKELLDYLLFGSTDEEGYINEVKNELESYFDDVHPGNIFYAKKTIRKIIRTAAKYIRYSNEKTTEIEIYLFVCSNMKKLQVPWQLSAAMQNLYDAQVKKIKKAFDTLHEDLQYDYLRRMKDL